jgi:hypothetical protein
VLARLPGERIGGEMSAQDRAAALREGYLFGHQTKIARSVEWQAAQLLQAGSMTLTSPDYPSTTVNFSRTGSHTKALLTTDRWGETGVSSGDDFDDWMNIVGEDWARRSISSCWTGWPGACSWSDPKAPRRST